MKTCTRLLVALLAAGVLQMPAIGQDAAQRDKRLARADHMAAVEGDLKGAIEEYRKIAEGAGSNRQLAAEALLRMADCHQKLGNAEARAIYQRVMREYADQRSHAARARAGLARLEGPRASTGIVSRQIWTGPQVDTLGAISPDGRWLSFVDWETGDLALRNISGGENRRLTNKGSWNDSTEFALFSRISPDGRQIAYNWLKKNFGWEVRVAPLEGTGHRVVFSSDVNDEYAHPEAWSPDGRQLALLVVTADRHEIGLVSAEGGSVRVVKSMTRHPPGRVLFAPDGRHLAYDAPQRTGSPERDIRIINVDGTGETTLVDHAADDMLLAWMPDGRLLFASDRSGTIDAWSVRVSDGRPQGAPQVAKKDLGAVDPLGMTRAGAFYYGSRADGPDAYHVRLDAQSRISGTPARVARRFIDTNIDPDWSSDGTRVVYVSERGWPPGRVGSRVLCIVDLEAGTQRELPASGTLPRWSPDGRAILARVSSAGARGLQLVDAATGQGTTIVTRGVQNARWSHDGSTVFILSTDYGRAGTKGQDSWIAARDMKTGEERELFRESAPAPAGDALVNDLSLSPDGTLLAFTRRRDRNKAVMVLPVAGGPAREVFRSTSDIQIPNFTGLTWTPDGREIVFVKGQAEVPGGNTRRGESELWAVPLQGGQPRPLGLAAEGLSKPHIHPGTRQLLYQSGIRTLEIWMLENLAR